MAELVTASWGEPHVTSRQEAHYQAGIAGGGKHALDVRGRFAASIVNANTLRIMGGDAICNGYHWTIDEDYEDLTIENGTPGKKRIDLVVARITTSPSDGCSLVVIKGEETTGTPTVPDYVDDDLADGYTTTDHPICSVLIDGVSPQTPTNLMTVLRPYTSFCPFPIGSVLQMTTNEDPNDIYEGTAWAKMEGRFLLGSSAANELGITGGEKDVVLHVADLPSHSHVVSNHAHSVPNHTHSSSAGGNIMVIGSTSHEVKGVANGANWNDTYIGRTGTVWGGSCTTGYSAPSTSSVGNGLAHNNMPPYEVVNMWKRTA